MSPSCTAESKVRWRVGWGLLALACVFVSLSPSLHAADTEVPYLVNHEGDLDRLPSTVTVLELRRAVNPKLDALARLTSLRSLNIRGVNFDPSDERAGRHGAFLTGVFSIPSLRSLSLNYSAALDSVNDTVLATSTITHIDLEAGNQGTARQLAWLKKLPHLNSLRLAIGVIDLLAYGELTALPGLVHLFLTVDGLNWPHAAFRHFCDSHPLLESLEVNRLPEVSAVQLNSILSHKALTSFRCFETPLLTFANTRALLQGNRIRSLGISAFGWKDPEDVAALSPAIADCQSLDELELLRPTPQLGSLLLVAPRRLIVNGQYDAWRFKMPPKDHEEKPCRLQELELSHGVLAIADLWQRPAWFAGLKTLSLWYCEVDWSGIDTMPVQTSLRALDIGDCAINAANLAAMLRKFPNLQNLSVGPLLSTGDARVEVDHPMENLQVTAGLSLNLSLFLAWFPKGCQSLTIRDATLDAAAASQLKQWNNLRRLYLHTCFVEFASLQDICRTLPALEILDLRSSRGLNEKALLALRKLRSGLFVTTDPDPE